MNAIHLILTPLPVPPSRTSRTYHQNSEEERWGKCIDVSSGVIAFKPLVRSVWDHLSFTTEHRIHEYDNLSPSTPFKISSGHYFFDTPAFVTDPITNRSVRIATLVVAGTIEGFIIRSYDGPAKDAFASSPEDGLVNTEVESRVLRVEIRPSAIALANAISLFLINWLTTVGSIYVTILVTSGRLEKNNVVAAGPFSALVAIPTVRSFYVGSPSLVGPVGESYSSRSNHLARGPTHSSRVSGIFRTDCSRGFLFRGLANGLHQL